MSAKWNYKIQVFGDSIHWGQGLLPEQKMAYLLKQKLESKNKSLKIRIESNAHSGATIGEKSTKKDAELHGEIPRTDPTILGQIDLAIDKDQIDLILVNGGINDVDVTNILNPITTQRWLHNTCKKMCHDRMTVLLDKILTKFPEKTNVMVTGYYPIISRSTVLNIALKLLILTLNPFFRTPFAISGSVLAKIVENCKTFANEANYQLNLAIRETNQIHGNRIVFVNPNFAAKNAVLAGSSSYLYGITSFGNPEDPMAKQRERLCPKTRKIMDLNHAKCLRASAGHPNPKGEKQYASEIFKAFTSNWPIPEI